jgi:uncharacterized protein (TIGR02284 family)
MHNTEHDIDTLNGLITVTIDSVDGYREAAKDSSNETFRTLFKDRANERDDVVVSLGACTRRRSQ